MRRVSMKETPAELDSQVDDPDTIRGRRRTTIAKRWARDEGGERTRAPLSEGKLRGSPRADFNSGADQVTGLAVHLAADSSGSQVVNRVDSRPLSESEGACPPASLAVLPPQAVLASVLPTEEALSARIAAVWRGKWSTYECDMSTDIGPTRSGQPTLPGSLTNAHISRFVAAVDGINET